MQRTEMAMMTHEVGGAIAPSRTALQLLRDTDLSSLSTHQQRLLEILQRGLERAGRVLDNLAAFSNEPSQLPIEDCEWGEFLEDLVSGARLEMKEKNLQLTLEAEPTLPLFPVALSNLDQVMGNLVSNAIKYSKSGGRIRIKAKSVRGAFVPGPLAALAGVFQFTPRYLQISITNDGAELSAETRRRLFEPFYRGPEAVRTKGSGLGLAVARRLVHLMSGDLRYESVSSGARFVLTLPADEPTRALSERLTLVTSTLAEDLTRAPHCVASLQQNPARRFDLGELVRACGTDSGLEFQGYEFTPSSCLIWSPLEPRNFLRTLKRELLVQGGVALLQKVRVSLRHATTQDAADAVILQTMITARRTLRAPRLQGGESHGSYSSRG